MIRLSFVGSLALSLVACASAPTPTADADADSLASATPVAAPSAAPVAAPSAEPTATPSTEGSAAPSASALAAPTTRPPSGRPWASFPGSEKISNSFGSSPPSKLELGGEGVVLRIPEYALRDSVNIVFAIEKKPAANRKAKGGSGLTYRITGQRPPSEAASTVTTDLPMELKLPLGQASTANLAIGEPAKDDKGRDIVAWTVVAPKKTESGFAYFDLSGFTDATLQLTSEAPSTR